MPRWRNPHARTEFSAGQVGRQFFTMCWGGEIGRRTGFRCQRPQGHRSSNLLPSTLYGTNITNNKILKIIKMPHGEIGRPACRQAGAHASGACGRKTLWVQIPPWAQNMGTSDVPNIENKNNLRTSDVQK